MRKQQMLKQKPKKTRREHREKSQQQRAFVQIRLNALLPLLPCTHSPSRCVRFVLLDMWHFIVFFAHCKETTAIVLHCRILFLHAKRILVAISLTDTHREAHSRCCLALFRHGEAHFVVLSSFFAPYAIRASQNSRKESLINSISVIRSIGK